ncbi:MAG TPA: 50S ribosomal protein L10 [Sulfolobales archaeon]|nr:50S ribosomal protein L10 [Sulfolobales archaeon]
MRGRTRRLYEKALKEMERAREKRVRKSIEAKAALAEEIKKILRGSKSFVVISATGLPGPQFLEIKKRLEAKGLRVNMIKGKVFLKAAADLGLKGVEKMEPMVTNPSIFVFSSEHNVFELGEIVRSIRAYRKAKPGDKADAEIVIPAGPTGIPPGPMISVFGRLKIPVQPRGSEIHVIRDTVVAKPGQEISPELASLLSKLGITPFIVKPNMVFGYEDGLVIPGERLVLDIEGTRKTLIDAISRSYALATEIVVPDRIVMEMVIRKAYMRALSISTELGIITPENAPEIIRRAYARALALAQALQGSVDLGLRIVAETKVQEQAKKEEKKEPTEEEKEKKEVSEEELEQGLSALFG